MTWKNIELWKYYSKFSASAYVLTLLADCTNLRSPIWVAEKAELHILKKSINSKYRNFNCMSPVELNIMLWQRNPLKAGNGWQFNKTYQHPLTCLCTSRSFCLYVPYLRMLTIIGIKQNFEIFINSVILINSLH